MPRLGLKLRDITDLLAVRDTRACPCEPAADLLHRRLTELDAEPTGSATSALRDDRAGRLANGWAHTERPEMLQTVRSMRQG
jgi:hypothetical protein